MWYKFVTPALGKRMHGDEEFTLLLATWPVWSQLGYMKAHLKTKKTKPKSYCWNPMVKEWKRKKKILSLWRLKQTNRVQSQPKATHWVQKWKVERPLGWESYCYSEDGENDHSRLEAGAPVSLECTEWQRSKMTPKSCGWPPAQGMTYRHTWRLEGSLWGQARELQEKSGELTSRPL